MTRARAILFYLFALGSGCGPDTGSPFDPHRPSCIAAGAEQVVKAGDGPVVVEGTARDLAAGTWRVEIDAQYTVDPGVTDVTWIFARENVVYRTAEYRITDWVARQQAHLAAAVRLDELQRVAVAVQAWGEGQVHLLGPPATEFWVELCAFPYDAG